MVPEAMFKKGFSKLIIRDNKLGAGASLLFSEM